MSDQAADTGLTPDLVANALTADQNDRVVQLRSTISQATETDPEQAAKALPVAKANDIPLQAAIRNQPELDRRDAVTPDMVAGIIKDHPITADYLSQPDNAALTHDDIPGMTKAEDAFSVPKTFSMMMNAGASPVTALFGTVAMQDALSKGGPMREALPTAIHNGVLQTVLNDIRAKQVYGLATPDDIAQGDAISQKLRFGQLMEGLTDDKGILAPGFGRRNVLALSEFAPQLAHVAIRSGVGFLAGGTVGTVVPGPGTLAGAASGALMGGAFDWHMQSVGQAYENLLNVRGKNGEQLDPDVARGTAILTGTVNGLLMQVPAATMLKTIPGGEKILPYITGEGIQKVLKFPGVQDALKKVAVNAAAHTAGTAATMGAMQMVTDVGTEISKNLSPGEFEKQGPATVLSKAGQAAEAGGELGLLSALPGTVFGSAVALANNQPHPDMVLDYMRNARAALSDPNFKLPGRSSEATRDFVNKLTGNEDFHIDPKAVNTFWQNASPEDQARINQTMPEFFKGLQEAVSTNTDVKVNRADYFTHLQPTKGSEAMDEYVRLQPEHYSAGDIKDYEEFLNTLFPEAERTKAETEGEIASDNLYSQLLQRLGVGRSAPSGNVDVARTLADVHGQILENLAARAGDSEAAQRILAMVRDVQVNRHVENLNEFTKRTDMDLLLDRLRKQKAPAKGGKVPTPILEYLASQGGIRLGTPLAGELRSMGIAPDKVPDGMSKALIKKLFVEGNKTGSLLGGVKEQKGLGDIDNLVAREFADHFSDHPDLASPKESDNGYVDRQWLLDQIAKESQGLGARDEKTLAKESDAQLLHDLDAVMQQAGIDLSAPNQEIKAKLQELHDKTAAAIKGGENTLYQSDRPAGLRSALVDAVNGLKQEKGTGEQILAQLRNTAGVKEEEIVWTGLDEFLKKKKTVTAKEVQDYLAANQVKIEPVTLSEDHKIINRAKELAAAEGENWETIGGGGQEHFLRDARIEASRNEGWTRIEGNAGKPRYASYVMPGGTNYREVLLTLPKTAYEHKFEVVTKHGDIVGRFDTQAEADDWAASRNRQVRGIGAKVRERDVPSPQDFKSSHFDEPNILAHLRLNDRVDANGKKVLFIEELQSDWHQKGRKVGYAQELTPEENQRADNLNKQYWNTMERRDVAQGNGDTATDQMLTEKLAVIRNELDALQEKTNGVPSAPFKKTWHEMAFRHIAQLAAQEGYDRVAWTPGDVQNDRYDLSKQVEEITANRMGPKIDKWEIIAKTKDGKPVIIGVKTKEELPDVVGKDLADKIVESGGGKFSGNDLKVGGEGMKGFYDKILPSYAKKFGKKFGAEVSDTKIEAQKVPIPTFEEYAQNAAAMFGDATPEDMRRSYSELGFDKGPKFETVHSMDISPEMRKTANEAGFTLFAGGPENPRGAITFTPDQKAVITLFAKEDLSTVLHELGHLYWAAMHDLAALADAPEQIKADVATMREWVKAKEGEVLTRAQEEQIADGFLAYLRKGEAPSTALQAAFQRFRGWLARLYRGVRDTLPEISPEVAGVFDRLVATDDEIEHLRGSTEFGLNEKVMAMLTKAEQERYAKIWNRMVDESKDRLLRKALRQFEKTRTAEYRALREPIRAEKEAEVNAEPPYRAIAAIQQAGKLSKKAIIKMMGGDEAIKYMPKGEDRIVAGKGGVDPSHIAGLLGHSSGQDLIRSMMNVEDRKDRIERLTDDEMIKRHGDMLHDGTIAEEAMKAAHNQFRAEMLHYEMKVLAQAADIPAPSKEAIVARVAGMLAKKPIKDIRPHTYYRAEVRSARDAGKALAKGNYPAAAKAKAQQLLNHHLYKQASEAKDEIDKTIQSWRRLLSRKDEKIGKRIDIDYIYAARAILAKYGIGRSDYDFERWYAQVQRENPDLADSLATAMDTWSGNAPGRMAQAAYGTAGWRILPYGDFQALADGVNNLLGVGAEQKQMTVDGKKVEAQAARDAVIGQMAKTKQSGIGSGYDKRLSKMDGAKGIMMSAVATWRRVEHWIEARDMGDMAGPFRTYIWNPVKDAVGRYRDAEREKMAEVLKALEPHRERLLGDPIKAPELWSDSAPDGYTFANKGEIIGMMMHLGNPSNKYKLLVGRGWGEEDADGVLDTSKIDNFLQRAHEEGIVTKEDWDLVRQLGDIPESMKADAQRAMKEMHGYRFNEVATEPVQTPFGEYAGWYWPAVVDRNVSEDAAIRQDKEAISSSGQVYMFPTTGRGFTHSRVEGYAGPLEMSLNLLPSHVDKVLRFIHIEPAIKDVAKVVMHPEFREALRGIDPAAGSEMLVPWLQRTARQVTEQPVNGQIWRFLNSVAGWMKTQIGAYTFCGNLPNTLIHTTQLGPLAREIGAGRMAEAVLKYSMNPGLSDWMHEMSPELRSRGLPGEISDTEKIKRILEDRNAYQKINDFSKQYAYITQHMVWSWIDHVGWLGAYNKALEGEVKGIKEQDHAQAVRYADTVVRKLQGSHHPEDISSLEFQSKIAKLFQFWYSFFNNSGNVIATEASKIRYSDSGIPGKAGQAFMLYLTNAVIVSAGAELLSGGLRGAVPSSQDYKDTPSWLLAMGEYLGSGMVRFGSGFVPGLTQLTDYALHSYGDANYADHITASPLFGQMERVIRMPKSLYDAAFNGGSPTTALGDALAGAGLFFPALGAVQKPARYAMGLHTGKIQPQGFPDVARGFLGGPRPSDKPQR